MNNERRKRLEKANELAASIREKVEELNTMLEEIEMDEQDAYDNLPEAIQDGERGQKMQEAIDALDNAQQSAGDLSSVLEDIEGHISTAAE